ncbi:MAG: TetR/AcrR family transcriptional regulator [Frankiales bacterium]|nr:TetR/AcrR family transcriptional regulator [Frankiales bacterium]
MAQIRRTQAERTAATRAALLTATVDTLVESGYRNTATQAVAKRAGVSYGALLHHFPTKADLLAAAVQHLFDQRIAEFRKAMADIPPDRPKVDAAIDTLWSMFQGPAFTAWLELWVAARTDPELAGAVTRVDQQFVDTSVEIFRELFADETAVNPALPRLAIGMTFTFLDGLALSHQFGDYQPHDFAELLAVFKMLVSTAMPTEPGANR